MDRNIRIAYIIATFRNAWFWLGIWILFYLQVTDYSGIGVIESILFFTVLLLEVPTGAFADIFGKRITLIISFFLSGICNTLIGFAWNTTSLAFAVIFGGVAMSLYSGAFDALVYDSLLQEKKESRFNRVISRINSYQLIMMAVCSVIGGFLYTLNNQLPFLLTAFFSFAASIFSFFLVEPHLDSTKFNFKSYLSQNIEGFRHLFNKNLLRFVIFLIVVSSMYALSDEMLDSILGYEFGLSSQMLGILFSIISIVGAFFSYLSGRIKETDNFLWLILIITTAAALTYILSPLAGIVLGVVLLTARSAIMAVHRNFESALLNQHISSQYRATTLSAFNLIKTLPYAVLVPFLGIYMQQITARNFAMVIGIIIIIAVIFQSLISPKTK